MDYQENYYRPAVVWAMALNATLSCFFYSYCISVVNMPALNIVHDLQLTDNAASYYSFFVSVHYIAAGFGAIVAGPLADEIGRRGGLMVAAVIGVVGCLMFVFPTAETLVFGRIITGIGAGIGSTIPPLYIKEISPPEISGRTGLCYRIMAVLGALCGYLIGLPLPIEDLNSSMNSWWIVMFVFPALPLLIQLFNFVVFFRYDTPSFSAFKRERENLTTILGIVYKPSNILGVKEKLVSCFETADLRPTSANQVYHASFREILLDPRFRKMLVIGMSLQLTSQWSGSNAIISFSTQIFQSFASVYMSRIFTVLIGCFTLLATFGALFIVDKLGRKTLLVYGPLILGVILSLMGFVAYFQLSSVLAMLFTGFFMGFYGLTLGAVTWTYAGEVLSNKALSLANFFSYMNVFAVVYSFHLLTSYGLYVAFWTYSLVCFVSYVFNSYYLFETKGLTKEDICELVIVPQKLG
jgi:MFS family permease